MGFDRDFAVGAQDVDGLECVALHIFHQICDWSVEDGALGGGQWVEVGFREGGYLCSTLILLAFAVALLEEIGSAR